MKTNKTKILFIALFLPLLKSELSTKQLLESDHKNQFDIIFLKTMRKTKKKEKLIYHFSRL